MFREYYAPLANRAAQEAMTYSRYLYELALKECEVRRANKIERLVKTSRLPLEKTLSTFDLKRLPLKLRQQVQILLEGDFVNRRENILAFGKPGSGKTHLLCAIGHELAHGVTEDEAQLQYFNQSGALNESMSDVFGSLIKQFVKNQKADQADWLIGADATWTVLSLLHAKSSPCLASTVSDQRTPAVAILSPRRTEARKKECDLQHQLLFSSIRTAARSTFSISLHKC